MPRRLFLSAIRVRIGRGNRELLSAIFPLGMKRLSAARMALVMIWLERWTFVGSGEE